MVDGVVDGVVVVVVEVEKAMTSGEEKMNHTPRDLLRVGSDSVAEALAWSQLRARVELSWS